MKRSRPLTAAVILWASVSPGWGNVALAGDEQSPQRYASTGLLEPDKLASAWLIARHVAPGATVDLLPPEAALPAGAVPFDVPGARWARRAVKPTYETILESESIDDPALIRIGWLIRASELASWSLEPSTPEGRFDAKLKELAMNDDVEGAYDFLDLLYRAGGTFPAAEE